MSILSEVLENTESNSFGSQMLRVKFWCGFVSQTQNTLIQIGQMLEPDFHNDLSAYLAL